MFDISLGELVVLGSVSAALAGRRDLPAACRFVGLQVGRVVGLLQGARARADRFSAQNELRQLQNELRSGLRELDQVKTELVIAASMGRSLGATTPSANRILSSGTNNVSLKSSKTTGYLATTKGNSGSKFSVPASEASISQPGMDNIGHSNELTRIVTAGDENYSAPFTPAIQCERATMEEEWEKQGISFRSTAEQGLWMNINSSSINQKPIDVGTGSEILENLIQQNLVFDQYDRVVTKQENEMLQRIDEMKKKKSEKDEERTGVMDQPAK